MPLPCDFLLPDEDAALLEALRRDTQCERRKALQGTAAAAYHLQNIRMNVRLLDAAGYREHTRMNRSGDAGLLAECRLDRLLWARARRSPLQALVALCFHKIDEGTQ